MLRTGDNVKIDVPFDYSVILGNLERPIEVKIFGHGKRRKFEDLCRKIVLAVHENSKMFGAHLSISGGLHNALLSAEKYGMDTVQVFTKSCCLPNGQLVTMPA